MQEKILIIGAGNMGGALARGLKASSSFAGTLRLHDVHQARLADVEAKTGAESVADLRTAKIDDDVIILCVKPQDLSQVAAQLKGRVPSHALVITILAGMTMEDVGRHLAFSGAVVRAMPNIAATVQLAATAMCANEQVTDLHKKWAETIFKAIGEVDWTKESLLDAVTGLSGSGPAYVYMVIEALIDGGVKMGIPRALASNLAVQTVLGAATLVKQTGLHPAVLKDQVTTPGGTTINALHELEDRGLRAMLMSAVETATIRSQNLRK